MIRWTLNEALRGWEYDTVEAGTVAGALASFEADRPAAVLLDINLPDGSGLDALREIKKRQPQAVVIMITANVLLEDTLTALRGGAYDFVGKPVDLNELQVTIRNGIEAGKLRKEVNSMRRDLAREPDHLGHRRRFADDLIEAESPLLLPAQITNLAPELAGLNPIADRHLKLVQVDRLADEVVSAAAQGRERVFEQHVGRDHNHDGLRLAFLNLAQRVESGSVRQIDILQNRRWLLRVKGLQRRRYRRRFERFISPTTQCFGQRVANRRIVINHEHFLFWHIPASLI
jgi:DNA-binding response OmpR family regulator